jgi:ribosomal protein S6--L-glutamate ligase
MKKSFRGVKIKGSKKLKNPFNVAKHLSDEGYKDVTLVVGSDRVSEIKRQMSKYVNHSNPKLAFYFDKFDVISAGQRNPDDAGVAGMSATKMRALAVENNFESFFAASPSDAKEKDTKKVFNLIRKELRIKEMWDLVSQILPENASEFMVNREMFNHLPKSLLKEFNLYEESDKKPTFLVLTTKPTGEDYGTTTKAMVRIATEMDIPLYPVSVNDAYVATQDTSEENIVIHNYYDNGSKLRFSPENTICLVRGSAILTQAGMGILRTLQEYGVYCINNIAAMDFSRNKFTTALALERYKIPSPKTALLSSIDSIDLALEKVGGEFPVVIKTISGAEGIGVSIVDSYESLKSVLQSLWKHEAELIIQEYIESDFDVRTVVVDNNIVASMKRLKGEKDFRTNKSLGNDTKKYILSSEEIDVIKKTAKLSGCDISGVDHLIKNGKPMVIEINGSPGFSAESYTDQKTKKIIGGDGVIKRILEYFIDKNNWKRKSKTIGVIEPITVEPFGTVKAKVDTGNFGYNVIDARKIEINDNYVTFKSNGKKHKEKIIKFAKINVGSGVLENRPVIKLNTVFYGKDLGGVLYSLTSRRDNDYKILLSKDFLSSHGYLVDVNRTYLTDTNESKINEAFEKNLLKGIKK